MKNTVYRSDIDGLRAIAVLSVLFFHLDSSYLPGGFLGVDVFFVISGYLITRIIYSQKLDNDFYFTEFYSKRIKRILPPIFLLLSLVYVLGYFIMLPYDFYKLCISIFSVLFFSSNIQYSFRTNDYFSGDSSEWPLLHTWSLSVEEQYYLLFPLILILFLKKSKNNLFLVLCILSLLSFCIAQYLSYIKDYKSISYYFIFTRMGELLIGSLLAVSTISLGLKQFKSNLLSIVSLIIILFLFLFVDNSFIFPGFIALLLCMPVAIIINSKDTVVNKLLSHKYLVYVGTLSYSLYLFHWPILAFYRYVFNFGYDGYKIPKIDSLILLVVIFLFSLFSFYFIEKPFRYKKTTKKQTFYYYFLFPSLFFVFTSIFTLYSNGLPSRFDDEIYGISIYSHIDKNLCPALINIGCKGGAVSSNKKIIVYGNSHAEHYYQYINDISLKHNYSSSLYASGGCGLLNDSKKCLFVKEQFYNVKEQADFIIIAYRWDSVYLNPEAMLRLKSLLKDLSQLKAKVIVMAQPPSINLDPKKINNCIRLGFNCDYNLAVNPFYPKYNDKIKSVVDGFDVIFFDPFINIDLKNYVDDINNFSDKDHLSLYGSKTLYNKKKDIDIFDEIK
ncbi:acyltransferase family protein [Shewanella vesiculosa]|uniref:Acyltransferase family protein n=1 Tax=Shewanella vesiculosa TaxID=518738 RepID=A0ABV0FIT6_9GAMM